MPLYDFICEKCSHSFDEIQKYDDDAPPCPECKGETLRQISAPSFVLKGEGWYKDGYSKKSQKKLDNQKK